MTPLTRVKSRLRGLLALDRFLNFNQYERDNFVKAWARSLAPATRVLDVGAGPARYRPLFQHCEYRTQDFGRHQGSSAGILADAQTWEYGQIDYLSDATNIPVASATFDAALCTEVLEHVPEPVKVLHELARIVREGGELLLTAPLGSGLHQEPDHYYGGFTPYWYRRFLVEAGFEQIEIVPNGGFFKWYGQESQRFSMLISPRRGSGAARYLLLPLWLLSWPYFRLLMPLACALLDQLDTHRGFTVGYFVRARRRPLSASRHAGA